MVQNDQVIFIRIGNDHYKALIDDNLCDFTVDDSKDEDEIREITCTCRSSNTNVWCCHKIASLLILESLASSDINVLYDIPKMLADLENREFDSMFIDSDWELQLVKIQSIWSLGFSEEAIDLLASLTKKIFRWNWYFAERRANMKPYKSLADAWFAFTVSIDRDIPMQLRTKYKSNFEEWIQLYICRGVTLRSFKRWENVLHLCTSNFDEDWFEEILAGVEKVKVPESVQFLMARGLAVSQSMAYDPIKKQNLLNFILDMYFSNKTKQYEVFFEDMKEISTPHAVLMMRHSLNYRINSQLAPESCKMIVQANVSTRTARNTSQVPSLLELSSCACAKNLSNENGTMKIFEYFKVMPDEVQLTFMLYLTIFTAVKCKRSIREPVFQTLVNEGEFFVLSQSHEVVHDNSLPLVDQFKRRNSHAFRPEYLELLFKWLPKNEMYHRVDVLAVQYIDFSIRHTNWIEIERMGIILYENTLYDRSLRAFCEVLSELDMGPGSSALLRDISALQEEKGDLCTRLILCSIQNKSIVKSIPLFCHILERFCDHVSFCGRLSGKIIQWSIPMEFAIEKKEFDKLINHILRFRVSIHPEKSTKIHHMELMEDLPQVQHILLQFALLFDDKEFRQKILAKCMGMSKAVTKDETINNKKNKYDFLTLSNFITLEGFPWSSKGEKIFDTMEEYEKFLWNLIVRDRDHALFTKMIQDEKFEQVCQQGISKLNLKTEENLQSWISLLVLVDEYDMICKAMLSHDNKSPDRIWELKTILKTSNWNWEILKGHIETILTDDFLFASIDDMRELVNDCIKRRDPPVKISLMPFWNMFHCRRNALKDAARVYIADKLAHLLAPRVCKTQTLEGESWEMASEVLTCIMVKRYMSTSPMIPEIDKKEFNDIVDSLPFKDTEAREHFQSRYTYSFINKRTHHF